jgi:zinc D-Ala-D-Ala dipeptidase
MRSIHNIIIFTLLVFHGLIGMGGTSFGQDLPRGFVDADQVIPGIVLDIRYFSAHNFVGQPIDGYLAPKCVLTRQAAAALMQVQKALEPFSLSLKLYDCYRPQRAVDHFIRWAEDTADTRMKKEFYPTINKNRLFKDGFISRRSGHSRGSTVDLTIVPVPLPPQEGYIDGQTLCGCSLPKKKRFRDNSIDMGTEFDCFHPHSWTDSQGIGPEQRLNRMLLKKVMEKNGFKNYRKEWWHYRLEKEPFPKTYFDFVIK